VEPGSNRGGREAADGEDLVTRSLLSTETGVRSGSCLTGPFIARRRAAAVPVGMVCSPSKDGSLGDQWKAPVVEQRINVITVGVANVASARDFYRGLGWHPVGHEIECSVDGRTGQAVSFQVGGMIFALAEQGSLAAHSGSPKQADWTGLTLTYLVDDPIDVEMVLAEARGAGATITQPACRTGRGGYHGTFTDLDGHAWEVLYDPGRS
jgi:uncharacterized protein